jgi:hypothetical protein
VVVVTEDKVLRLLLAQPIQVAVAVVDLLALVIYTMVVRAVLEWLFFLYQQQDTLELPQALQ